MSPAAWLEEIRFLVHYGVIDLDKAWELLNFPNPDLDLFLDAGYPLVIAATLAELIA